MAAVAAVAAVVVVSRGAVAAPPPSSSSSSSSLRSLSQADVAEPALEATIPAIQGRGATSPLVGRRVATAGVVTRVDGNGFFLQDAVGDGDPLTSDAVFVFTGAPPAVKAGQCVRVQARVAEFDVGTPGNRATAARTVTELHDVSAPELVREDCAVAPVELRLPLVPGADLAALEGMLVTLRGPLTVQQNYWLGRFGQLTLAVGGRIEAPTNRLRPGAAALALAADNARRAIVLDDGSAAQYPVPVPFLAADGTVRAGDTVSVITGVIDYGLATSNPSGAASWKIHPVAPVQFARANPRPLEPGAVGGNLRIAAANVDNFFSTIAVPGSACAPRHVQADCRGARSTPEFERQRAKLVEELAGLDADIVGLMEIENNGSVALRSLLDALNARVGPGAYAAVSDPREGTGGDAIKVALIYRPARVRPVGLASSDPAAVHNRAPLAQTFELLAAARKPGPGNGARLNVIVSHFKSRRCDGADGVQADQGDLQGCWNPRRLRQARALRAFAERVQRRSGVPDTLLIGDFNAYAKEDPLRELERGGFADQAARFERADDAGRFGYSYVFDGAAGRIDQVFASRSLAPRVTGAIEWHVNADEPALLGYEFATRLPELSAPTPYRASDHDPVLVGLALGR